MQSCIPPQRVSEKRQCHLLRQLKQPVRNNGHPSNFVQNFAHSGVRQMENLRLLVADDHEIVRKGLRSILEAQPGWQVAAEASDGREAVEKAKELKPDVTVLDISMPSLNGLEGTRQILKNESRATLLILTMPQSHPPIREVLHVGARDYVLKT